MTISQKTGKGLGKVVSATKAGPKATARLLRRVGTDLKEGYREAVPAKPEK
jgi:hypothetical protein